MEDKILTMFFEKQRWEDALNKASGKGISTAILRDMMTPEGREKLLASLLFHTYHIERPHTALIPKDTPGEYRTVFVNSGQDRIFLSIVNDLLFEITADMIHPSCQSYQKGIGCSQIVTKASVLIDELSGSEHKVTGWKSDLSKYFDSVPIHYIDKAFDKVEEKYGHSVIIDVVREYYHNDQYLDTQLKQELCHYQSLKQGCAVASWLANVILYDIDAHLSSMDGVYVRYSDDMLFIGKNYEEAMQYLQEELSKMDMKLNPKKVEYLTNDRWFKFLGYSIKGRNISLSRNRIKTFAKNVASRTIFKIRNGISYEQALKSVQSWLYYGDGEHSWATGVLKTINSAEDIKQLNSYVMDCLRAVQIGKSTRQSDIGGLGWINDGMHGCIARGKGRRVRTLRNKTRKTLDGYHSLNTMRNALLYSRDLYDCMVREI